MIFSKCSRTSICPVALAVSLHAPDDLVPQRRLEVDAVGLDQRAGGLAEAVAPLAAGGVRFHEHPGHVLDYARNGARLATEIARIALMSDDLSRLPWLIRHSRRTLGIVRQNITLSLLVKALFVVLTFVGFASLWAAIAADMGVSLLVIFNALRLLAAGG